MAFKDRLGRRIYGCYMDRLKVYVIALLVFLGVAGCTNHPMEPRSVKLPAMDSASIFHEYKVSPGDVLDAVYVFESTPIETYHLQVGDLLSVRFSSLPKLDIDQRIRPDGMLSLPYIGDVRVVDLSPSEAQGRIRREYGRIMRSAQVDVFVLESSSSTEDLKQVVQSSTRGQSKRLLVRPDGWAGFPGIGDILAAGKSLAEISAEVNEKYRSKWPQVEVNVLLEEAVGAKIYVLGQVNRVGGFSITSPMTIPQALALAGGLTGEADTGCVYIAHLKGREYQVQAHTIGPDFVLEDGTVPLLSRNDILFVPRDGLAQAAQVMDQLSSVILFRGWGFTFTNRVDNGIN